MMLHCLRDRLRGPLAMLYKTLRGEVDASHLKLLRRCQHWPPEALRLRQWQALKQIVRHAWSTPFYRQRLAEAGIPGGDLADGEQFARIPLLKRTDLSGSAEKMVAPGFSIEDLQLNRSSGSTGEPTRVYLDARRVAVGVAGEVWADSLSGWRPGEPVARVWGGQRSFGGAGSLRRSLRKAILDPGFWIDAYNIAPGDLDAFVRQFRRCRPTLVVGYASALRLVAGHLLECAIRLPALKAVVSSAEGLDGHTRKLVSQAFSCPVLDRYGCREAGLIACQCRQSDGYHVNMPRVYVEILDEAGDPVPDGASGRVVLTDLANFAMPLIRYEVGDQAAWAPSRRCLCGSGFEALQRIDGRVSDFIRSSRGEKIHWAWFTALLFPVPGVRQFRLVQESPRDLRVEIVPSSPLAAETVADLQRRLEEQLGSINVRLLTVARISQAPSGKYRCVESEVKGS